MSKVKVKASRTQFKLYILLYSNTDIITWYLIEKQLKWPYDKSFLSFQKIFLNASQIFLSIIPAETKDNDLKIILVSTDHHCKVKIWDFDKVDLIRETQGGTSIVVCLG